MGRSLTVFIFLCVAVLVVGKDSVEVDEDVAVDVQDVGEEEHSFKAETSRLMDIIVHSLYSDREIFLRELVSNAADACDKFRMLKLSNNAEIHDDLDIRVGWNRTEKTITIADKGIGMTKAELINNLGTIAKSGTSAFMEKYKDAKDESTLIGQFGVGFYSSFLVADTVSVSSKNDEEPTQHTWTSAADGEFTITEEPEAFIERGSVVTLHLRKDAEEYLDFEKLRDLLKKYSSYIEFPIYLEEIKTKPAEKEMTPEEEVEKLEEANDGEKAQEEQEEMNEAEEEQEEMNEAEEEEVKEDKLDDDEVKLGDEESSDDSVPSVNTETVEVSEWQHVNDQKPIWRRDPENVTEAEYLSFYDSINKTPGAPISSIHFKAEGEVEFKALLYIPDRPPYDMFDANDRASKDSIRLYVRRVLLKGHFEGGLLPRYLGFITGIVDSDDLPINISRETLQESKSMDLIRKKLVRKTLEMLKNLMKDEEKEVREAEETEKEKEDGKDGGDGEENAEETTEKKKTETKFLKLWKKYGVSLKLGVMEDRTNQKRLTPLLRFRTSKTNLSDENDFISFDEYVERMKEGQEYIYYLAGTSVESIKSSPFLERLVDKGYEVLYLSDPIDEYWTQSYTDHEGVKLMSISKDSFTFSKEDEKTAKKQMEEARKGVKPLTTKIKEQLSDRTERVKLSNRLRSVPMMISAERTGFTANMELVARAQSFADPTQLKELKDKSPKKVVEVNPYHPLIKKLAEMVRDHPENDTISSMIETMYDTALVASGFHVFDTTSYAERMSRLIAESLNIDFEAMQRDLQVMSESDAKDAAEDVKRSIEEAKEEEERRKRKAEEEKASDGDDGGHGDYHDGEGVSDINLDEMDSTEVGLDGDEMMDDVPQTDTDDQKEEL